MLGGVWMSGNSTLICQQSIRLGNEVMIASGAVIIDTDAHTIYENNIAKPKTEPIVIGDHVWICMGAKVLKGVTIGSGAVIASGAVVVKDVPANSLAAGVPARVIRENISWVK
jgi:acetyltransferase-like isoleucine patch superfamily enzyme